VAKNRLGDGKVEDFSGGQKLWRNFIKEPWLLDVDLVLADLSSHTLFNQPLVGFDANVFPSIEVGNQNSTNP
jgi:hypothetical protein